MDGRKDVHAVSTKGSGFKQKLHDAFIPEDVSNIGLYFLTDWILPGIWDFIQAGVNSMLPKTGGGSRTANISNKSTPVARIQQQIAYNKRYEQVNGTRANTDLGNYAYIKIPDRANAEMVRMEMIDIIGDEEEGQGQVSIGWFLDRCNMPSIPAAAWNWGWRNLDYSRVERYEDGWRIVFPRAISLKS